MPRYDVRCADHGEHEVFSLPSIARHGSAPCGECATLSPLVFTAAVAQHVRIDNAGEDLSVKDAPGRVADGTHRFNMGLPGVQTSLGRDAAGKEHFAYRPITNREVGGNAGLREIAARKGLTPYESGRYKSLR